MTKEAVCNTLNARPFKPFKLRLTDGRLGRTAVVNTEGEQLKIIDLALVTAIELAS
jgi:hypothetical protein